MGQFGNFRIAAGRFKRCSPRVTAAALAGLLILSLGAQGSDLVELSGAWVRAMPPTQRMTAAYMHIHNPGSEAVVIVDVSASAGRASLHETRVEAGRSMMRAVSEQTLGPGEGMELQPGGMHIMITDLDKTPAEGELLTLCVSTYAGETCTDAPVRRNAPEAARGQHKHRDAGGAY